MSKGINKTGYKGISFQGNKFLTKPYIASINVRLKSDGRSIKIYVGHFETPELAYIARCKFLDDLK